MDAFADRRDRLDAAGVAEIAPGVRRLVAPNPGPMTGPGTNTYLVGRERVVVVDPGPAIAAHLDAIADAVGGAHVEAILVTHTHADHSPGAAPLRARLGGRLVGALPRHRAHHDATFVPDEIPEECATYAADAGPVVALATPGHASNHVCWYLPHARLLCTGDHVLGTVSPVILAPDGDMAEYLESLRRIRRLDLERLAPGHGPLLERPVEVVDGLIRHRLAREAKVAAALAADGPAPIEALLARVYADVDAALHRIALHSLEAHLLKLERDGRAARDAGRWRAA